MAELIGAPAGYFIGEIGKRQPGGLLLRTGPPRLRLAFLHLPPFNSAFFMEAQIEKIEQILPEDLARAFESAYHVFQGKTEHVDDLLKHGSVLLRKAAHKFTPTQMIIGIAAVAAVAVVLINRATDDN
jgi:recombination associated protein RdgC